MTTDDKCELDLARLVCLAERHRVLCEASIAPDLREAIADAFAKLAGEPSLAMKSARLARIVRDRLGEP
jgi:hypothetical protein